MNFETFEELTCIMLVNTKSIMVPYVVASDKSMLRKCLVI